MTLQQGIDSAELERRAAAGEPEAQFGCALAILAREVPPAEGLRAIELVERAARQGHAESAAMSALFEAMGAARPQSWPRAFDQLQRAAELGSISAQGQLMTLAGPAFAKSTPGETTHSWSEVRAQISAERLLQAPARQLLCDSPRIVAFSGFATEAECRWAIERARDLLQPAAVFHTQSGDQTLNAVRDNSAIGLQLPQMDVVLEVLRARISSATRLPVSIFEPAQVLRYAVGEQFRPHHDFLDPSAPGFAEHLRLYGQRIATVLVYLNQDYTGGETIFPKVRIRYRGGTGDALFFTNVDRAGRPDPLTMHAGTPPVTGEKWVISQWIRDRAPAPPDPTAA